MGENYTGLTDLEVTLGGGIPSMIYCKYQHSEMTAADRFTAVMEVIIKDKVA